MSFGNCLQVGNYQCLKAKANGNTHVAEQVGFHTLRGTQGVSAGFLESICHRLGLGEVTVWRV